MNPKSELSIVTQKYLHAFHCILEGMIEKMTQAPLTYSISHNFIVQMLPHHRAAIEMSQNLLKYTTNIPLQDIASHIITSQTKSMEDMRAVKGRCERQCNSQRDFGLYQHRTNQIMQAMFAQMKNAPAVNNINVGFMREMIPHHLGAIAMSENALNYDICPELKPILQAIITSQKRGVTQMRQLLQCMGC